MLFPTPERGSTTGFIVLSFVGLVTLANPSSHRRSHVSAIAPTYFLFVDPIERRGATARVHEFYAAERTRLCLALTRSITDNDIRCAMVEDLSHLRLVQWQVLRRVPTEYVPRQPPPVGFELLSCTEEARIIGHVEHSVEPDCPTDCLWTLRRRPDPHG